ncbi:MAG TPA: YjbQ family protein [Solirubrobacterales bacterium]|jgi:thiamine phosphate synthase YjbQ (UPF0047 family)
MKFATRYLTFNTEKRRELIRITEELQAVVDEAGIEEGMVLASAMHITAGVFTAGHLDLGPWQQVFYCEFDGGRPKRVVIKAIGE